MAKIRSFVMSLFLGASFAFAKSNPIQTAPTASPLNEIYGTIEQVDADASVIRILTSGGYHVEIAYTRGTVVNGIGVPKAVTDLSYQDQVCVRYPGKSLVAAEIEKRSLQPAVAASSTSPTAN